MIEGHTDASGWWGKELNSSKDEQKAAKDYLIGKGMMPKRLTSEVMELRSQVAR